MRPSPDELLPRSRLASGLGATRAMAPEAYEAPFRRWERHDFLRPSFDAPSGLCQYRHVPTDVGSHVACRFPFQSEVVSRWRPGRHRLCVVRRAVGRNECQGQAAAWSWRTGDGDCRLRCQRNLSRGLYRLDWRIDLRGPLLPEEVQIRDRDAEIGDGTDPATAQTIEKRGEECRREKPLNGSPVRATYSPI